MIRGIPVKIVLVGDSFTGKTSLQVRFVNERDPTVEELDGLETVAKTVKIDNEKYNVSVVDTMGSPEHDDTRPNCYNYPNVDVFLLCYSVCDRLSFENVTSRWVPEIKKFCPTAKVILVGTKTDRREKCSDPISEKDGNRLSSIINASAFTEVSLSNKDSVEQLFMTAVCHAKYKTDKKHSR